MEIENVKEVLEGKKYSINIPIRDCVLNCLKKLKEDCKRFFCLLLDDALEPWDICIRFYNIFNPDDYSDEKKAIIQQKFYSKRDYCKRLFYDELQQAKCVKKKTIIKTDKPKKPNKTDKPKKTDKPNKPQKTVYYAEGESL